MTAMTNLRHSIPVELVLFYSILIVLPYLTDGERQLTELNSTSFHRTEVTSDKHVFGPSRTFVNDVRNAEMHTRCRRFAQTIYKPYQHLGTYVYSPYGPYIVPPICIQCPTCCPRPCRFPTPSPIRTTYGPHGTTKKFTVTPRTTLASSTRNTKKGVLTFTKV